MAFDLDDEELEATRKLIGKHYFKNLLVEGCVYDVIQKYREVEPNTEIDLYIDTKYKEYMNEDFIGCLKRYDKANVIFYDNMPENCQIIARKHMELEKMPETMKIKIKKIERIN